MSQGGPIKHTKAKAVLFLTLHRVPRKKPDRTWGSLGAKWKLEPEKEGRPQGLCGDQPARWWPPTLRLGHHASLLTCSLTQTGQELSWGGQQPPGFLQTVAPADPAERDAPVRVRKPRHWPGSPSQELVPDPFDSRALLLLILCL